MCYRWNGFLDRTSYGFILCLVAAALVFGGVSPRPVEGGETSWVLDGNPSWEAGDWFDPANWSAGVPGPGDDADVGTDTAVEINGSTELASLLVHSGYLPRVRQNSGAVTISGALTIDHGNYYLFPGASLSAGEIRVPTAQGYFAALSGTSVQAGLLRVGRGNGQNGSLGKLVHSVGTPNPNLSGWLVGGDGQGGAGQITFQFGGLPAMGPIVFEQGRSYSMKEVALAINAASQAALRYDAAGILYDSGSNLYSLRVAARKAGVQGWDSYGENKPTQQGMAGSSWSETNGAAGAFGEMGFCSLQGDIEVERLHIVGGRLTVYEPTPTVTVTDELFFSTDSVVSPRETAEFRMVGADLKNAALEPQGRWNRVTMRFMPSEKTARLEADAIDVGPDRTVWEPEWPKSMIFGALHVGSVVELVDEYGNQLHGGVEALYVHDLVMEPGGRIDGGLNLYYLNGGDPKQFFRGDANLDGKVGLSDLAALADHYGRQGGVSWGRGDFNGDDVVGLLDLVILADNYGAYTQPVAPPGVPEPATCVVLSVGGAAALLLRGRRRRRGQVCGR